MREYYIYLDDFVEKMNFFSGRMSVTLVLGVDSEKINIILIVLNLSFPINCKFVQNYFNKS